MSAGDTLIAFEPTAYFPPASSYATPDLRNAQPVLDFDAAGGEIAFFAAVMPRHYGGGGIVVQIQWTATSATSGNCTWEVSIERHDTATDLDSDSFATAITGSAAAAPTTNGAPKYTEITLTNSQIDGLVVGEHFRLKITRTSAGGMSGDAELWGIEIREAA